MKLCLAFLFLVGCASPVDPVRPGTHYTVFADATSMEAVSVAALVWESTGAVTLDVMSGACAAAAATICVGLEMAGQLATAEGGRTWRDWDTDSATIVLAPGMGAAVVEHELGHAFGLEHTGPGTIMCWETGCMAASVTAEDVAQFRALR